MKNGKGLRETMGKPKLKDFSFTAFFHPEKAGPECFRDFTGHLHYTQRAKAMRPTLVVYDSKSKRPARKHAGGYVPQAR